jgi:transcriptional regulator with XRE-family HTH domain
MAEPATLGTWLRRERERRGVTLAQISEQTKVSVSLLEGLEADDLSRWPGGIFRRSFARSYASAIGLDRDLVVRRIDEEHPEPGAASVLPIAPPPENAPVSPHDRSGGTGNPATRTANDVRLRAALLDLLVALAIGLGFAAGGSRLLWPVLAIAAYHALGLLLVGMSPMAALLADEPVAAPPPQRRLTTQETAPLPTQPTLAAQELEPGRRADAHVRRVHRGGRRSGTREQVAQRR